MDMAKQFAGKVAVVTGAASGIGRGAALAFAKEGAKVIVTTDSNIKGGEETVSLIKAAGGEATFVKCDVVKEKDVENMVAQAVTKYGALDFAFNNAGIGPDGKRVPLVNIVDHSLELWSRTIDINLTGVFLCTKHEMKQMMKQKTGGSIVITSSIGAYRAVPGFVAYDASKSGIFGLARCAALEGAKHKIRVNTVCPGPIQNTLLNEYLVASNPAMKTQMANLIPMGYVGEPEDIAGAVIYFCSEASRFVTGQILSVDGGMTTT
jgi:NAD(P)-dependent dehydrogenase (short-subunit alcohol dehydrogenase family)